METHVIAIRDFVKEMGYIEDENVLGIIFYGSYLRGKQRPGSDIDMHVIYNNKQPERIIRGSKESNGIRVEYFEKPIADLYASIDNSYSFVLLLGNAKVLFDRNGSIKKLQEYANSKKGKRAKQPFEAEEIKEFVSIMNNRIEKLEQMQIKNNPMFNSVYYQTLEKIRKFYHRVIGADLGKTTNVAEIYTDSETRELYVDGFVPEEDFINKYLYAASVDNINKQEKYELVKDLWSYAKRDVELDPVNHRIQIKSWNVNRETVQSTAADYADSDKNSSPSYIDNKYLISCTFANARESALFAINGNNKQAEETQEGFIPAQNNNEQTS